MKVFGKKPKLAVLLAVVLAGVALGLAVFCFCMTGGTDRPAQAEASAAVGVALSSDPPSVNYKWELPDMDSSMPGTQYQAPTPTDLNANGIPDADDDPLTPGMQMKPNVDDMPERRGIEFWVAADDPDGVADIAAAWVVVFHPDGSFKYWVDLMRTDCSDIGYYDDSATPPILDIGGPLLAAIDTNQMTLADAEDLVMGCYKNEKVVFRGVDTIHDCQPAGVYLVRAHAWDWGDKYSTPLENTFAVPGPVSPPDLVITKTASPAEDTAVATGGTITYTLIASNAASATGTAIDVPIRDTMGSGLNLSSVTPGAGVTCPDTTPPEINCIAASIAPGESRTVTVVVTVTATTGPLLNGARVDPTNAISESNEDADDPDYDCTVVGEGTDAGVADEPDNFDCTSHSLAPVTPTPTPEVCPPVVPGTYNGNVTVDGAPAPDGTIISAVIEGITWSTTTVSGARYALDIPEPPPTVPPCFEGGTVTFQCDSAVAAETVTWSPGLHDLDLTCGAAVPVEVDIKPGSDRNSINPGSKGVIPVAILSTDDFDATTVDPATVRFGPSGAPVDTIGGGKLKAATKDVNHDGVPDLIMHFRTQQTGIHPGDTQACLTGQTYDGTPISGCDSVRTVPPDADGDGDSRGVGLPRVFGDDIEASLVTDDQDSCPDDPNDNAWPPDLNNDAAVNILDVILFRSRIMSALGDPAYEERFDLSFDGTINVVDVVTMRPFVMTSCE